MGVFELNVVGAIFGFIGALIGLLPGAKWNGKWFTASGHILVFSVIVVALSQVSIQIINNNEKNRIRNVISNSLSGWIKVGTFSGNEGEGKWIYKNLPGLKDIKPVEIVKKYEFMVGTGENYFINVRYDPPEECDPNPNWFNNKENIKNVLSKNSLVYVKEVKVFDCVSGNLEVWVEVDPLAL